MEVALPLLAIAMVMWTRDKLETLAGQTVRFRWRMGTDKTVGPWLVRRRCADLHVVGIPSANVIRAFQQFVDSRLHPIPELFQLDTCQRSSSLRNSDCFPDSAFIVGAATFTSTVSEYTFLTDLIPNAKYYWHVRAVNAAGGASNWKSSRYFRTALLPPVAQTPGVDVPIRAEPAPRGPTFTWLPVAGATGYTVEVSTKSISRPKPSTEQPLPLLIPTPPTWQPIPHSIGV